jgi:hypothetical protein
MDFLVVYSNYSTACNELFQLYPNLKDTKGVCADNSALREVIVGDLKIAAVPALLVIDDEKILQRVIGVERIRNWLWMVSAEIGSAAAPAQEIYTEPADISAEFMDDIMPSSMPSFDPSQMTAQIPSPEYGDHTKMLKPAPGTVKNRAEEMQREREQLMKGG